MSYLEKAKRALDARAAAMASPRCSRCMALDAQGVVVLTCPCGYTSRASRTERGVVARSAYRQALRISRIRAGEAGRLRSVEVSEDD
jgi:hypothetical protein